MKCLCGEFREALLNCIFHLNIVDGSRAGSGNLEILVNGGRVTSSVRSLGMQKFIASFTSHEPGPHTVQITFNGDTVPGNKIHSI